MTTKFTIYLGLNDRETGFQKIGTIEAYKICCNLIARRFNGGNISESDGIYHNPETGAVDIEKSFRIEIFADSKERVQEFGRELCDVFNQHSVIIQRDIVDSEEIVRS